MSVTDSQGPVAGALESGLEAPLSDADKSAEACSASDTTTPSSDQVQPPRPAKRRRVKLVVLVVALVVAVVLALAGVMFAIVKGFQRQSGALEAVATTEATDDLELGVTVLNVDPTRNEVTVRLDYVSFGRYESKDEPGPAIDLQNPQHEPQQATGAPQEGHGATDVGPHAGPRQRQPA